MPADQFSVILLPLLLAVSCRSFHNVTSAGGTYVIRSDAHVKLAVQTGAILIGMYAPAQVPGNCASSGTSAVQNQPRTFAERAERVSGCHEQEVQKRGRFCQSYCTI